MNKKQFKTFQNLNRKLYGKEKFIEEVYFEKLFNERLTPEERQKYKELHDLYNLHLSGHKKTGFKPI